MENKRRAIERILSRVKNEDAAFCQAIAVYLDLRTAIASAGKPAPGADEGEQMSNAELLKKLTEGEFRRTARGALVSRIENSMRGLRLIEKMEEQHAICEAFAALLDEGTVEIDMSIAERAKEPVPG